MFKIFVRDWEDRNIKNRFLKFPIVIDLFGNQSYDFINYELVDGCHATAFRTLSFLKDFEKIVPPRGERLSFRDFGFDYVLSTNSN